MVPFSVHEETLVIVLELSYSGLLHLFRESIYHLRVVLILTGGYSSYYLRVVFVLTAIYSKYYIRVVLILTAGYSRHYL